MNKVILCGRIGKEPTIKQINDNTLVEFSLATRESQDKTEWHSCKAWNKVAEIIDKYANKGSKLLVAGKLQTSNWEKDGHRFYRTDVIVNFVELLEKKNDNKSESEPEHNCQVVEKPEVEEIDNDLPF